MLAQATYSLREVGPILLGGQAGIGRWMKASLTKKPRILKRTDGKRVPVSFLEVPDHNLLIRCPYTGCRQRKLKKKMVVRFSVLPVA